MWLDEREYKDLQKIPNEEEVLLGELDDSPVIENEMKEKKNRERKVCLRGRGIPEGHIYQMVHHREVKD